ncbi:MAG: GNAT family acetyltransferase [Siculibacillus sp.]|nr:GNAT family acetyltransferase [Siculibacillus sp.]
MSAPVIVREPAEIDVAAVVALWGRCGLTRPWNDPVEDIRLACETGHGAVLAATCDGRLVGAAMVGHDGHRGAVYYLGVDPDARRGGIGRQLVEAAEAWVRERGIPKINLLVRKENAGVLAFYEALGWHDTHTVCLYRTLDPAKRDEEARMKAEWATRIAAAAKTPAD